MGSLKESPRGEDRVAGHPLALPTRIP